MNKTIKNVKIGKISKKILFLLATGLSLSLSSNPQNYFRILNSISNEWKKFKQESLHKAIRNLYTSKLLDCKDNKDGTISMILSKDGKRCVQRIDLNNLVIKKPKKWDGLWRIVIFDIPEYKKKERKVIAMEFRHLGLYQLQKSVYVYPYEFKNEIELLAEFFGIRPFFRFITANDLDSELELRDFFDLLN